MILGEPVADFAALYGALSGFSLRASTSFVQQGLDNC